MSKPISFEAVKLALKQDKNGHVLTLVIHPQETPDELWRTPAGQRYGVALVQLDDDLRAYEDTTEGERTFRMAAAKCRDRKFQAFLGAEDEASARTILKKNLGIASSTEIRDNPVIREKFLRVIHDYENQRDAPR